MKKISNVVTNIIDSHLSTQLKNYMLISSNWNYAVGEELENVTSLHSIQESIDRSHSILYMNIVSSYLLIAKGREFFILERLKTFIKTSPISKISFRHWVKSDTNKLSETKKNIIKIEYKIEEFKLANNRLHSALEELKTEIQNAA